MTSENRSGYAKQPEQQRHQQGRSHAIQCHGQCRKCAGGFTVLQSAPHANRMRGQAEREAAHCRIMHTNEIEINDKVIRDPNDMYEKKNDK